MHIYNKYKQTHKTNACTHEQVHAHAHEHPHTCIHIINIQSPMNGEVLSSQQKNDIKFNVCSLSMGSIVRVLALSNSGFCVDASGEK